MPQEENGDLDLADVLTDDFGALLKQGFNLGREVKGNGHGYAVGGEFVSAILEE